LQRDQARSFRFLLHHRCRWERKDIPGRVCVCVDRFTLLWRRQGSWVQVFPVRGGERAAERGWKRARARLRWCGAAWSSRRRSSPTLERSHRQAVKTSSGGSLAVSYGMPAIVCECVFRSGGSLPFRRPCIRAISPNLDKGERERGHSCANRPPGEGSLPVRRV
jgi:hypothetical protein